LELFTVAQVRQSQRSGYVDDNRSRTVTVPLSLSHLTVIQCQCPPVTFSFENLYRPNDCSYL